MIWCKDDRLPRGGGKIIKGAMPWSHRHIGNPLFTFLVRSWFNSPINDVYCGMRAFKKSFYDSLKMRCTGMEFATEMIIKAANFKAKTVEFRLLCTRTEESSIHRISGHKEMDGKLFNFSLFVPLQAISSTWLNNVFVRYSGWNFGLLGFLLGAGNLGCTYNAGFFAFRHQWLSGCFNAFVVVGPFSKTWNEKLGEQHISSETHNASRGKDMFTHLFSGVFLWGKVFLSWQATDFGPLDYAMTMKIVIPGATLISLSLEMMIFTFFRSWVKVEVNN